MVESKVVLYFFMFAMLICGTLNTIAGKAMDLSWSRGSEFNHPYFQTAGMFLGEFMCFLYYFIYKKYDKSLVPIKSEQASSSKKKTCLEKMGIFVFIIPSSFDFTASTLMFVGLALSAPSVYQMMRGFIMVVVALYSIIFLKIRLFRHQYLGVLCALIGVVIVGLASVIYESSSASNPVLGVIIIVLAQFFAGGVFVSEQLFLENVVVHPLQAVGIEGMTGFGYYLILLPIFNLIPCSNDDFCNGGFLEDSVEAFKQIGESWEILTLFLGFMISISLFNFTGVTTTKKAGALARSTIDTSRTLLIWMFSIAVGWEDFIWLQLIGFFFLVIGTLIYNEILVIPFWGFKESIERKQIYTKNRAEKNNLVTKEKDNEYLGFSPGAIYNQSYLDHKQKLVEGDGDLDSLR
jgi:drug/metabolite transporter (DMT)-like permease